MSFQRPSRSFSGMAFVTRLLAVSAATMLYCSSQISAAVLVSDGFGDADRDNDGVTDGAAVADAADTGIRWFSMDQTSGGLPKPALTVEDDSAGIGSGNALFAASRGSNAEMMGRFDSTISLGGNVGDKLIMSFDMRIDPTDHPLSGLSNASIRFGLYQDSDNQLGSAGWGTSDGKFDNGNPGARGDAGFQLRLPLGSAPGTVDGATDQRVRINDETVSSSQSIFGGSTDFVRGGSGPFPVIGDALKHHITFTLERTGLGANDFTATLELDGNSFGGNDASDTIASVLSFQYFAFQDQSADFDYVLDNFRIAAVPEPNSFLLLASAGLLAACRRNVRQRHNRRATKKTFSSGRQHISHWLGVA
jgi:PEP-CTERM motif